MKLFHTDDHPSLPADPARFTGDATMARTDALYDDPRVNVYRVRFQPRARTDWHTHTGGPQLLLVIEGVCRVQKAGEASHEITTGGSIRIEPGERHWHGATPAGPMTHLAVNVDAGTDWHEKVTDAEYGGTPA